MPPLDQALRDFPDERCLPAFAPIDEAGLRDLADAMPQIVWSARPDGFLDYYNARWYEFTGFQRGTGGDESWKPILHPDDLQPCLDAWYGAVGTGEPYEIEYRFRDRRTGSYRWHLGRALPVKDADGRVTRWFGTCTDIHEHKQALQALEDQTTALHDSDRRKDEFLAMLAHEIRNPLASMVSAVALLRTDEAEERAWATEVLTRQTGQLTRLSDDLLDVARISTGKICLRKEPLDLATVLDRAVETMRPAINENQHELVTEYPRSALFLEADAARLEQIIVNLLANAAKYTPPRGHLSLRATREDGHVEVVVQDDGLGISSEKLPVIFNLFTQGERSGTRSKDGLGLGLAIVKKLAELHDGTVSASSAGLGLGSAFTVRLPAGLSSLTLAQQIPKHTLADPSHTRILVVDDHVDSARGLARLFQRRGYQLQTAYDGPGAIAAATAFQPAVILLDIDLPQMNGCEVAARLRRDPAHRHCLLIALSGYGGGEDRKRCLESGCDHHVLKPVDLEFLHGLISEFLAKNALPVSRAT